MAAAGLIADGVTDLTVQQIHRWCDGVTVSPDETIKKRRLKQLLA